MKSPSSEKCPPNPQTENLPENMTESQSNKEAQTQMDIEKDSGYSDSSSESISSEETKSSTAIIKVSEISKATAPAQASYTPIYIVQNIVLKQPRLLILQTPIRRHRKRPKHSSYLPILQSYARIAPKVALPPTPISPSSYTPHTSTNNQPSLSLLELSLRSLALLRRNQETQRSIRQLRAHTRQYDLAIRGEEGGWERLCRAMDRSGGYKKYLTSSSTMTSPEELTINNHCVTLRDKALMPLQNNATASDCIRTSYVSRG
ncbi:uncharacterized protein LOC108698515 [Xenopus laevis]|uniref:Uncharacterized protein n=2 Tax=Xenopus laevis TaxID=8355 RepID=A0A974C6V5_XENLA|nr:uncharacterized protein LOC108698515 [Xenopus laevis]OCT67765.1 hypothetical protein XELAEV_18039069mg [Xenopus laevis]